MFFSSTPLALTALLADESPISTVPPWPGSMTTVPLAMWVSPHFEFGDGGVLGKPELQEDARRTNSTPHF
jgi:hypothetical protein